MPCDRPMEPCAGWDALDLSSAVVTIHCHQCVRVDSGLDANLGGLVVLGRLVLDASVADISIRALFVVVEGELVIPPPGAVVPHTSAVRITIRDGGERSHRPQRASMCGGGSCSIGMKPFAVIGGRLDMRGLEPACRTWAPVERFVPDGDQWALEVDSTMVACWGEGSTVAIASDEHRHTGGVTADIASVTAGDNGRTVLRLDRDVGRRMAADDDPRFAVEVALLSRNVVIEGEDDEAFRGRMGAHSIIMETPVVAQTVDGVRFRRMGQQGVLGRCAFSRAHAPVGAGIAARAQVAMPPPSCPPGTAQTQYICTCAVTCLEPFSGAMP